MVRTLASSAWQSRGDEAKRMVKEAWTSSLDWVMKKLPPTSTLQASKRAPVLPVKCRHEMQHCQHLSSESSARSDRGFL